MTHFLQIAKNLHRINFYYYLYPFFFKEIHFLIHIYIYIFCSYSLLETQPALRQGLVVKQITESVVHNLYVRYRNQLPASELIPYLRATVQWKKDCGFRLFTEGCRRPLGRHSQACHGVTAEHLSIISYVIAEVMLAQTLLEETILITVPENDDATPSLPVTQLGLHFA